MIRTVVAFNNEGVRNSIADTLERNGISIRYRCRTGHEVIRAIKKMGGGVVVCDYKLLDFTAEQLAYELGDIAAFLVISKPQNLELCEHEDVFKLAWPPRTGELTGAVHMLIQLEQRRSQRYLPKRSADDESVIHRAKLVIMEKNNMSEEQAYRFIQRRSMETAAKMSDTARLILEAFD